MSHAKRAMPREKGWFLKVNRSSRLDIKLNNFICYSMGIRKAVRSLIAGAIFLLPFCVITSHAVGATLDQFTHLLSQGEIEGAKDELRSLYKNHDIDNDELLRLLDQVDAQAALKEREEQEIHEMQRQKEIEERKAKEVKAREGTDRAYSIQVIETVEPTVEGNNTKSQMTKEQGGQTKSQSDGKRVLTFKGISLGEEAERLLLKYKISLDDVSGWTSDESCDRIAAKRLISCVYRIASCIKNNGDSQYCPAKDSCASDYERGVRAQEDRQCREEASEANKLDKWSAKRTYAIRPRQIVCAESNQYREVANAYRDGNLGPLRRESGYGCRVIEEITLAKILGKSKDGKLYHVEYPVPYSTQLTDGWLSTGGLISKSEYLRSRF